MGTRRYAALLAPALLALAVAGCGGSDNNKTPKVAGKPAPSQKGMPSADTGAVVDIGGVTPGEVVTGNSVRPDIGLSNFRTDCRLAGTPNKSGVGHYHLELDGKLINMFCDPTPSVSLQNVKPGKHEIEVLPATNDHTDDMGAEKKVSFVYKPSKPLPAIAGEDEGGKPQVQIVSPRQGETVSGSFDLTVKPRNFEFSCALYGKNNVKGYGHWHINVDSTKKGMTGMATMLGMSCERTFHVSLAGIAPGEHTFFAILEDNQHAPTIGAQDSVRLDVQ